MSKKEIISIIIPCYNEEDAIPVFYEEITKISKEMNYVDFEYMFIDDGSSDKTLEVLRDLHEKDKRVEYCSFSKNYGKEAGMYAGLQNVTGDYVAIMDVDLQDPPEKLIEMYETLQKKDYDCVALYTQSHEGYSAIRKKLTNIWYRINNKLLKSNQKPGARDFRLMTRQMVDSLLSMKEYNRYIKGMFDFIGFKTKWISYDTPDRSVGTSKFSIIKLMKYAIEGIISTTTTPLIISVYVGLTICLLSFIMILIIITKTIIWGDPVQGWPSMICILLFLSGIELFFLGIIGTYLAKIYLEVKERPVYIIKEKSK